MVGNRKLTRLRLISLHGLSHQEADERDSGTK
jgi:hypothetical protein